MPTSAPSEPESSRLGNIALAVAAVLAVVVAAEFGLRLANKDYKDPASGGLIHRGEVSGTPDTEAPFITNANGLLTARSGAEGINADGFRTLEFADFAKKDNVLLLLGDAQAYGIGADPITRSLADLLSAKDYTVVNLGIPGAGVRQYAALAERYVALLKPNVVLVLFNTSDDFEVDPPVQPGSERSFYISGHAIPATDGAGQPFSPEEAIAHANAAAESPGALVTLLRNTAIGVSLLNSLGVRDDARRVPDIEDALNAVRDIADNNAAIFQLVLTPMPEDTGEDALARAAQVLNQFGPASPGAYPATDFADPGFATLNNSGHEKLAHFIAQQLDRLSGLSPINVPLASEGTPVTLEEFCEETGLVGNEKQKALDFLNGLKEEVARIVFEPALDAPSPGEFAVGYAIANATSSDFGSAFMDYVGRHIHAATGLYYIDLMGESIQQRCTDFQQSLPESVRPNFAQLQRRDIGNIDTGTDPLSEHITAKFEEVKKMRESLEASPSGGELSWEEFASGLQLTPEQAGAVREHVDKLKAEFAEILSRPGKDGAPSPVQQLGELLRENAPQEALGERMKQATAGIEGSTGKSYLDVYMAREAEIVSKLLSTLTPEQVALYPTIKVSGLLKVKTDTEPFNDAIAQVATGGNQVAPEDDPNGWTKFRADLNLNDEQADTVRKIINGLKDKIVDFLGRAPTEGVSALETMRAARPEGIEKALAKMLERAQAAIDPASGKTIAKLMEEAEIEAHKAIYLLLTPQQIPEYEKGAARSLAGIRTGHEPLEKAIAAP